MTLPAKHTIWTLLQDLHGVTLDADEKKRWGELLRHYKVNPDELAEVLRWQAERDRDDRQRGRPNIARVISWVRQHRDATKPGARDQDADQCELCGRHEQARTCPRPIRGAQMKLCRKCWWEDGDRAADGKEQVR